MSGYQWILVTLLDTQNTWNKYTLIPMGHFTPLNVDIPYNYDLLLKDCVALLDIVDT